MSPERSRRLFGPEFGLSKKFKCAWVYCTLCIVLTLKGEYFTSAMSTQEVVNLGKSYCPNIEFCNDKIVINSQLSCCTPCSCDDDCLIRYDCCPDAPIRRDLGPLRQSICTDAFIRNDYYLTRKLMDVEDELPTFLYGMVITCKNGSLCPTYTTNTSNIVALKDSMLVVGTKDNLVYRNMYCAQCNNVYDYIKWKLAIIECESDVTSIPYDDVMDYAEGSCVIASYPPSDDYFDKYSCHGSTEMISTCNETKEWDNYDKDIEKACHDLYSVLPFSQRISSGPGSRSTRYKLYRNVFCYICNHGDKVTYNYSNCPTFADYNERWYTSYTDLVTLNIDYTSSRRTQQCEANEIFDSLKNTCRELYCFAGTVPLNGGCVMPSYVTTKVIYYTFNIELRPVSLKNIPLKNVNASKFFDSNTNLYKKLGKKLNIPCELVFYEPRMFVFSTTESYVDFILVPLSFIKSSVCNYDYLAHSIQEMIDKKKTVTLVVPSYTLECSITIANKYLTDRHVTPVTLIVIPLLHVLPMYHRSSEVKSIDVVKPFGCPYIVLNESEYCTMISYYNIIRDNTDTCSILFDVVMYNNASTNLYSICLNTFDKLISVPSSMKTSVQGILSLVLTCLSILCIIICLGIYIYLHKINNVPMLVFTDALVNLFIAQTVFQFGSSWRQYKMLCEAVGILVHFFWLSAVFSMKLYCILVYKYIQSFNESFKKTGILAFIYIYGLPLLLVTFNVIYTNITSNDDNITTGYGTFICHIDNTLMRTILFLVPILLSVICCCILYIHTVYRIREASHAIAAHRSQGTEHAGVYMRLLLFTGISWFFGLIQEFVPSITLQYLFIVTLPGQGIFLLLSTLFTKTIRKHIFAFACKRNQQTITHRENLRNSSRTEAGR
ncbi:hypothetical protein ACF0H5_024225 [Mactra antiquata]